MIQVIFIVLFQILLHFNSSTAFVDRKVWFSQNGIEVCSLCTDNGLYQMNVEGNESFLALDFTYIDYMPPEVTLIEIAGPKRFINSNKYQQDVRVRKGLSMLLYTEFTRREANGDEYRIRIQVPVLVGYHCY